MKLLIIININVINPEFLSVFSINDSILRIFSFQNLLFNFETTLTIDLIILFARLNYLIGICLWFLIPDLLRLVCLKNR